MSPKIKQCTFSTLHRILIISFTLCVCGCFCSSHPCWNVICTITISYKISSNAILFKLPNEVCVETKPVGDNKEVNKIYSCCVLLTCPCLKNCLKKKILNCINLKKLKKYILKKLTKLSCTYFLWVFLLFTPYMERSLYCVVKV